MTPFPFPGFQPPTENWSRLPNQLIDLLPGMNAAELKVVIYILRHTWGYGDAEKRISIEEFCHGRRRTDGSRIDAGCGLTANSVRTGLDAAVARGLISVFVDDSDLARVRKFYALRMAGEDENSGVQNLRSGVQNLRSGVQNLHPGGANFAPRTKKETIERNTLTHAESPIVQITEEFPNPSSQPQPAPPPAPDPRIISEDPVQGPRSQLPLDPRQLAAGLIPTGKGKTGYEVYREFFDHIPGRTVIQEMNRTVGADPADIQRWRSTLAAYALAGKASNWVKIQLDWFRDGVPANWDPTQKGPQNGTHHHPGGKPPTPRRDNGLSRAVPADDQERITALLAGKPWPPPSHHLPGDGPGGEGQPNRQPG